MFPLLILESVSVHHFAVGGMKICLNAWLLFREKSHGEKSIANQESEWRGGDDVWQKITDMNLCTMFQLSDSMSKLVHLIFYYFTFSAADGTTLWQDLIDRLQFLNTAIASDRGRSSS